MPFHFRFTHAYNSETFFLNPDNLTAKDDNQCTALVQASKNNEFTIVSDILQQIPKETNQDNNKDIYGHIPAFYDLLQVAYQHRNDKDKKKLNSILALIKTIIKGDLSSYSRFYSYKEEKFVSAFEAIIRINDPELLELYVKTSANNKFVKKEPFSALNRVLPKEMIQIIVQNFPATTFDQRLIYRNKLEKLLNNYSDKNQDLALLLIKQGAFLHINVEGHSTALHWAIIKGKNDFIRAMITSPVCPWGEKSAYLKFKLTPLSLAKQLAPPNSQNNNIISNLIEDKAGFLDNLLFTNSNKATKTFSALLFEEVEKEDFQLDQDFYQGLIHRLLQVSPLPIANMKTIETLLKSKKFDIECKFNDETPLQAVMNANTHKLPDLSTLVFLMNSGAEMTVKNQHCQTLVQQILFSDLELKDGMQNFIHSLVMMHPELTQTEGHPIYNQLTIKGRSYRADTACFTFGLHVRAYLQAILTPNSRTQYNNQFFSKLLLDSSSSTNLSKIDHFGAYRKEALNVIKAIVAEYKGLPNASELQQSPILELLKKMLNDPLFKTHGKFGAITSSIYKRETTAIDALQKLITECESKEKTQAFAL